MGNLKGQIAIVGIGEVPTGKFPERDASVSALVSMRQAILDAGINKDEIDVILTTQAVYSLFYTTELVGCRLVEELGLGGIARNAMLLFSGGSSSTNWLKVAAGFITLGMAKCILCVHSDQLGTGAPPQQGIDLFAHIGFSSSWEAPYGMHFSPVAALTTQRYMYETGTTAEQLASVCVSNRKWAELNPNAMFRRPLTVEEVLSSKMLSRPLHAKESNMLADGGAAFIVTSAERAPDICEKPVYVLGEGSRVTHYTLSQCPDLTRFGWAAAAKEAFEEAGVGPADMDIAELYDSYPIYELIAMEELGLCGRGEGGAFFQNGHTWPGGKLPTTTNGGMLSQGHTGAGGSVAILVETARQLMGKAGERQVHDAKLAVETAVGGAYMDAHVTVLGNIIP